MWNLGHYHPVFSCPLYLYVYTADPNYGDVAAGERAQI